MDIRRDWSIVLIEPNKYQGLTTVDVLRACGASKIRVIGEGLEALESLRGEPAQIILASLDIPAFDALAWTKAFRREKAIACRKAPVFLMTAKLSRAAAEECRHAGANAIVGKPMSAATLGGTIRKVLANPRPFIDAAGYVGPCRRAGIVTTAAQRRRRSDTTSEAA